MDKRINVVIAVFVIIISMFLTSSGMAMEDPTTKPGYYPPEFIKKKNPLPLNLQVLREGRQIYWGHCQVCHGVSGDGQGDAPVIAKYDPMPRNFTDTDLMDKKTDGMLYYSVTQGVHGTMMIPREIILSEHQRWAVIHFIRTFAKPAQSE